MRPVDLTNLRHGTAHDPNSTSLFEKLASVSATSAPVEPILSVEILAQDSILSQLLADWANVESKVAQKYGDKLAITLGDEV